MKHKLYPFLIALLAACLAACAPQAASTPSQTQVAPIPTTSPQSASQLQRIDLGVGYIPNTQFAPLYVAQSKGFFAEQGLEVVLDYGVETDFVALTGQGKRQLAIASGDQVVLARAQGIPVVYVAKWFQRYPVGVMALAETGIDSPKKLEGHSVGTPMLQGASYVGWKALAVATKLDEKAIQLEVIGFAQVEAITEKVVDAAVIYVANEPVHLRVAGKKVDVLEVSDYVNMVSNGIISNEETIKEQPELVRRFVTAFLMGLQYTLDHPDEAFTIVRQSIPELTDDVAPVQRAVLDASLGLWRTDQLGLSDRRAWLDTVEVMKAAGLIESSLDVDTLYTNKFVE